MSPREASLPPDLTPPCSVIMEALERGSRWGMPQALGGDWNAWAAVALAVDRGTGRMICTVRHDSGIETPYAVRVDYS